MPFIRAYTDLSDQAYVESQAAGYAWHRLAYGANTDTQYVNMGCQPAAESSVRPAPVFVFLHGGYWQELSAEQSLFPAAECVDRGWSFAAVNYTLAPQASLTEIVAECVTAVRMIHDRSAEFGIDRMRIVVGGSSAGAHLAAMVALALRGAVPISELVLISGIYWLEPLIGTSINRALKLTPESARQQSPGLWELTDFPPTTVIFGEIETDQFKEQSKVFAQQIEMDGGSVAIREVLGRNHFDVTLGPLFG